MSDKKISELASSTTPLAGTEVLPIVQSGITKQVSVANLTFGRAISASEATLTTGNLVIGTAGKGIDFSADSSAAGMTSELLDDYEEGTWTPMFVPSTGSFDSITYTDSLTKGWYTKVGNIVYVTGQIRTDAITVGTASGTARIGGLPFSQGEASIGGSALFYAGSIGFCNGFPTNNPSSINGNTGSTEFDLRYRTTANGAVSVIGVTDLGTGASANRLTFNFFYTVS